MLSIQDIFGQQMNGYGRAARRTLPRDRIFKIQWPKSDSRALGLPGGRKDSEFWELMGFARELRVNDKTYTLRDTRGDINDLPLLIEVTERKSEDIAALLATPDGNGWAQGNLGLVGSDVLSEFHEMQKNHAGPRMDATLGLDTLMDTDLSRGALSWIVRDNDSPIRSLEDFAGRDIVTKYPNLCSKEVRRIDIMLRDKYGDGRGVGRIKARKGGTEYDFLDDQSLEIDLDFVQSFKSARDAGLMLPFIKADFADALRQGKRFDDLTPEEMSALPCVVQTSVGMLVSPRQRMTQDQLLVRDVILRRAGQLIRSLGRKPDLFNYPANDQYALPSAKGSRAPAAEIGHGQWHARQ